MANNRKRPGGIGYSGDDDYGNYNGNYLGSYDDGGYSGGEYYDDGYVNDSYSGDGYYDEGGYLRNGGYSDDYYSRGGDRPSMAARAAGKKTDPYAGRRDTPRSRQANLRRKRKKRHGFRNFLIFLLFLAVILGAAYVLLFRAPDQATDYVHTRDAGVYNILVAATDEEELRTDTLMIATLDLTERRIALTSLPRDTIVDNGEWVPKLNGVYGLAGGGEEGAEALLRQVKTLLGFRPDGYIILNYDVFQEAVDALGGVTFDVPMEMEVDVPPDYTEFIHLYPGEQLLDGRSALAVCRYRYGYLMADIQRQYVQQSFLKALIRQALLPTSWPRLPAMLRAVMGNTVTDLSGANLRWLAVHALFCGVGDMTQNTLPGEGVDYNGASCYGLYGGSVVDMVNAVMNPYEEDITLDDVYILSVYDGELVESTWRGEAFDASAYDYDSYG